MTTTLTARAPVSVVASATTPDDVGKLVLRLSLGLMLLLHGIAKMQGGVEPIAGMLSQYGLPGFIAYGAYVGEVVAPLLVVAGLFTRPAALVIAFNMLVAIALAHGGEIFQLNEGGGWAIELQGFYLFGAVAVALLGAGALSAAGKHGRWN